MTSDVLVHKFTNLYNYFMILPALKVRHEAGQEGSILTSDRDLLLGDPGRCPVPMQVPYRPEAKPVGGHLWEPGPYSQKNKCLAR